MNKREYDLLSSSEVTCILVGFMVGMGALILPNDVMATANQDGWISATLGAIYPLIIMFLSVYIIDYYDDKGILDISRKLFGKVIGNIFNLIFGLGFIYYCASVTGAFSNMLRLFMVFFLQPINIMIIVFILAAYTSGKGIKVIARINEVMVFFTIFILIFTIAAIQNGSFLNVSPVFSSGFKNIVLGAKETIFAYACSEFILVIPAHIRDRNKIKGAFLKAIGITAFIYTWITFITIYYLGPGIVEKNLWSFLSVTDSVKIPLITNFRFVFALLWSLIILKTISNFYYISAHILSDVTKIKFNIVNIAIFPVLIYLSLWLGTETFRRALSEKIVPYITVFNIVFIFSIAVIIFVKKVSNNEEAVKQK